MNLCFPPNDTTAGVSRFDSSFNQNINSTLHFQISHEGMIGIERISSYSKELDEIGKLDVDITAHRRHQALHRLYVPLLHQNRSRLIAKPFSPPPPATACTPSDARSNGPDPHATASFSVSLSLSQRSRSAPPRSPISRIESRTKIQTANRPISAKSHRNRSTKLPRSSSLDFSPPVDSPRQIHHLVDSPRQIHHRGSGDVDSPRQIHHRGSSGDVIDRVWEGWRWVQVNSVISPVHIWQEMSSAGGCGLCSFNKLPSELKPLLGSLIAIWSSPQCLTVHHI
uniref:Uncharacterized protein n=1 Tax=Fagus sylvatica TaxID=28930 RepID=A0A2N9H914_FAGSY